MEDGCIRFISCRHHTNNPKRHYINRYDAHIVMINSGEPFNSRFVVINPNSKIPACVVKSNNGDKDLCLFESGSIILHLCEKYIMYELGILADGLPRPIHRSIRLVLLLRPQRQSRCS